MRAAASARTTAPLDITPMDAAHWPDVRRIYEEGIATGRATFETESPGWEAWDASHRQDCRFVARRADRVVGWIALSAVSRRHVYRGVAEVSVYVAAKAWGTGVGRALFEALIPAAEAAGRRAMDHGMKKIDVFVKGPGSGRETAIRSLGAIGLEVGTIQDVTPTPHNGCRPPKRRRV